MNKCVCVWERDGAQQSERQAEPPLPICESMNQSTIEAGRLPTLFVAQAVPLPRCVTGFYALRDHMKKLEMPTGINLNVNTK